MKAIGKHDDGTGPDFAICAQPQWTPASGPRPFRPVHRARRASIGGTVLLRIEDIDPARSKSEFEARASWRIRAGWAFVARACACGNRRACRLRRRSRSAQGEGPALSLLLLAAGDCGGSDGHRSRWRTALSGDVPAALPRRGRERLARGEPVQWRLKIEPAAQAAGPSPV